MDHIYTWIGTNSYHINIVHDILYDSSSLIFFSVYSEAECLPEKFVLQKSIIEPITVINCS